MKQGEGAITSGRVAQAAWAVLVSLALIACGSETSEPLPAKRPKSPEAAGQKAINPSKITLKEYAALDEETRMAIARSFAERNAQGIAVLAAEEEKKAEAVPEGSVYVATEFDLSGLPNDADIDSHLMSVAGEKPDARVSTEAAAFITEKNIEVTKVEARVK